METKEVKDLFNKFKKAIKKEGVDLTGRCYMNAKQAKNGTATIFLATKFEFDPFIASIKDDIARVQSYDSWTAEEKAKSKAHSETHIAFLEAEKAKYGTRLNQAKALIEEIANSQAFKKFCEAVGAACGMEEKENAYYLRLNY